MIPRTQATASTVESDLPAWQQSLRNVVSSLEELLELLELSPELLDPRVADCGDFPLRVPREFVARMRPRDPRDPLLQQVLPTAAEFEVRPGYREQPLEEELFAPRPGLIQKYRGRVLVVTAGSCAINCRYCFRRNFPYASQHPWAGEATAVVDSIAADPSIREVILSGGDPLVASDRKLAGLVDRLSEIEHLDTLRIHTRLPVVLPSRVDQRLLQWLGHTRLATVVVLHANHPQEIDGEVGRAVSRLRGTGVTVLNQSVLLAGVNDRAADLITLSRSLFAVGVLPYYLHLLDRVQGAAHFEVATSVALRLVEEMRQELPGYLVPRLVREVPGAPSKVPVTARSGL